MTDLIKHHTVTEIVAQWEAIKSQIAQAMAALVDCETRLEAMLPGASGSGIQHCFRYGGYIDEPASVTNYLEGHIWGAIFNKAGVYQYLSVARTRELEKMLTDAQNPCQRKASELGPITTDNVFGMLNGMLSQLGEFMDGAVAEVYDILRPAYTTLKTNNPNKGIGETVILHHFIEKKDRFGGWKPRVNYSYQERVRAIDRVFHMLDGQGYVNKSHYGELGDALRTLTADDTTCETRYFKATAYMNGNLKLKIKRPDLLAKLNKVGGQHTLKRGDQ